MCSGSHQSPVCVVLGVLPLQCTLAGTPGFCESYYLSPEGLNPDSWFLNPESLGSTFQFAVGRLIHLIWLTKPGRVC